MECLGHVNYRDVDIVKTFVVGEKSNVEGPPRIAGGGAVWGGHPPFLDMCLECVAVEFAVILAL
jgi:hypothetical protein